MSATYTLKLTQDHLSVIAVALAELPYKRSAGVIKAIQDQINAAAAESKPAAAE